MVCLSYGHRRLLVLLLVSTVLVVFGSLVLAQVRLRNAPGVAILDKIELSGLNANIDSYNSRISTYSPEINNNAAVVTVNSKAFNTVTLSRQASIKGDVYVGPGSNLKRSIRLSFRSRITGEQDILSDYISIPIISEPNMPPFNALFEACYTLRQLHFVARPAVHL